jgi:hypothetical protein
VGKKDFTDSIDDRTWTTLCYLPGLGWLASVFVLAAVVADSATRIVQRRTHHASAANRDVLRHASNVRLLQQLQGFFIRLIMPFLNRYYFWVRDLLLVRQGRAIWKNMED